MTDGPLLSYLVLSYDYADHIGGALRSILDQTVTDAEVVVVDDASHDASVEVVRGLADPRIRLLVNERNLGGAASYNRAVEAARGEWLVNVDADDWIAPGKAAAQLAAAAADPGLDIIGTWVSVVDADGGPHPLAPRLEADINRPHEFGRVDTWIGANLLCRSSTMVRRSTHLRIGLDDPTMRLAPDYELWTRALRAGCRFGLVPERLTHHRLHARGVTHADPVGTLLEMSHAMLRNLVPLAEERALLPSIERMLTWVARHPSLSALRPIEVHRLLGMFLVSPPTGDHAAFRAALAAPVDPADDADRALVTAGRRALALLGGGSDDGLAQSMHVRWHEQQARSWKEAYLALAERAGSGPNGSDGVAWRRRSEAWEAAHRSLTERLAVLLGTLGPGDRPPAP